MAVEAPTPELRPHRVIDTRALANPEAMIGHVGNTAAVLTTEQPLLMLSHEALVSVHADNCHKRRWGQAKYRGPAPPSGFARASITIVIDMLLLMKLNNDIMPQIGKMCTEVIPSHF